MAQQQINIGVLPNDGTGDPLRVAFQKINQNFTEIYGAPPGEILFNLDGGGAATVYSNSENSIDGNGA